MTRLLVAALALGLVACGPSDRLLALQKEVSDLQGARIERERVEKARSEADEMEKKLADAKMEQEKLGAEAAAATKELEGLTAAFEAEQQRNVRLRSEIEALAAEVQKLGEQRAELLPKLDAVREAANDERDQADGFARALRGEEPEWARQRRLEALRAYLNGLAKKHASDPAFAALAARAPGSATPEDARTGAELAQQASQRLAARYELGAVAAAGGTPSEGAPAPVGTGTPH